MLTNDPVTRIRNNLKFNYIIKKKRLAKLSFKIKQTIIGVLKCPKETIAKNTGGSFVI